LSGSLAYLVSKFYYDKDFQYQMYTTYPREMKYYDEFIANMGRKKAELKARLPFKGEFPDLTKPENFNKFKHELKNYFFNVDLKKQEDDKIQKEILIESKGIFFPINLN
jgi:hypothetical protein